MVNKMITPSDLETIKDSLNKVEIATEDRPSHLETLFLLHQKYFNKAWAGSARTCGSCVNQVKNGLKSLIKNQYGE
tara:strand:+ start:2019 stop:2246 length:228 start_codon:yes stop_codon:yes gene_type:complete